MQRKRADLRRSETSTSLRDRTGIVDFGRRKNCDSIHAASRSGKSRNRDTIYSDIAGNVVKMDPAVLFNGAYGEEPFVRLLGEERLPDTKNVVGTNFIDIAWKIDKRTRRLVVMSAIDNIVKGASGQAVQCMNLM